LSCFTRKRFETFLRRREEWLETDEASSVIAKKSLQVCPKDESLENCGKYFFHQKCYNLFTDISKIKRAEQQNIVKNDESNEKCTETESPKPKRQQTRASAENQPLNTSNKNVLPDVCIICKKKTSYINDTVSKPCIHSYYFIFNRTDVV
jgi:hypothetical protein